jgi:hypothetical protein
VLPLRDKLTSSSAVSFRQASGIHRHRKKGRYRESQWVLAGTNRSCLHGFQPGPSLRAFQASQCAGACAFRRLSSAVKVEHPRADCDRRPSRSWRTWRPSGMRHCSAQDTLRREAGADWPQNSRKRTERVRRESGARKRVLRWRCCQPCLAHGVLSSLEVLDRQVTDQAAASAGGLRLRNIQTVYQYVWHRDGRGGRTPLDRQ